MVAQGGRKGKGSGPSSRCGKPAVVKKNKSRMSKHEALTTLGCAFWDLYLQNIDWIVKGTYKKYRRFIRGARGDLKYLCLHGANPAVVVAIVYANMWWLGGPSEESVESQVRRVSRHVRWRRTLRSLRQVEEFLAELESYSWLRTAVWAVKDPSDLPFIRVAKLGSEVYPKVKELREAIAEARLDTPGWILQGKHGLPEVVRDGKMGRARSGRPKQHDWAFFATELHEYLMRKTGRPHWAMITRLLHCAGVKEFPRKVPREGKAPRSGVSYQAHDYRAIYADNIKKRVKSVAAEPEGMQRIPGFLNQYEEALEPPERLYRQILAQAQRRVEGGGKK